MHRQGKFVSADARKRITQYGLNSACREPDQSLSEPCGLGTSSLSTIGTHFLAFRVTKGKIGTLFLAGSYFAMTYCTPSNGSHTDAVEPQGWGMMFLVSPTPALTRHREPHVRRDCPMAGVSLSAQARQWGYCSHGGEMGDRKKIAAGSGGLRWDDLVFRAQEPADDIGKEQKMWIRRLYIRVA